MQNSIKSIVLTFLLLLVSMVGLADEKVTFETNAPMIVSVGEAFRVEFSLNAKPDDQSFAAPSFEGFDVLAGPAVSQGSSVQIINGSMTKSVSYTITYVLLPHKAGEYHIGKAEAKVSGKTYYTRDTALEVRDNAQGTQGQSSNSHSSPQQQRTDSQESRAGNQISKDDLLLRLVLSRNNVYKGEPVRATLKLFSRVSLAGSEGAKMPTFNGFWSQDIDVEQGPFRETYAGKVYDAYNLAEYLLYPQQSGVLKIEPAEITVVAQIVVQSNRGFDPFFGGGHDVYNVRRTLTTPAVSVNVREFPDGAPASFDGAVGKYTMDAKLSNQEFAANSSATLTVRISGNGNIGFVQAPKISLPASFELYETKSSDSVKNSASGSMGQRTFDYPFIARAEGDYDIEPVEFSYFNPETGKYVTLSSEPFHISVAPDSGSSSESSSGLISAVRKEDVKLLGSDIRYIKLGNAHLRDIAEPFFLSGLYFAILAVIALLTAAAYLLVGKRMRENQNVALVRGRRANKVAVQRFRKAEMHMKAQDRHAFFEEMLKAMWGYLSDRFNIPVSDLTKESVREELSRRGAQNEAKDIISVISSCEEAQYAPSASVRMQDIYSSGIEIVSRIESIARR